MFVVINVVVTAEKQRVRDRKRDSETDRWTRTVCQNNQKKAEAKGEKCFPH